MSGGIRHNWLNAWIAAGRHPAAGAPSGATAPTACPRSRCPAAPGAACPRPRSCSASARTAPSSTWSVPARAGTPTGPPAAWASPPDAAAAYLPRLLTLLADEDVLSVRVADDGVTRVYGLQPGHIRVRLPRRRRGAGGDARLRHLPLGAGRAAGAQRRLGGPPLPPLPLHRDARRPAGPAARATTTTTTATCTPGRCPTRSSPPSTSARCPAPSGSRSSAPSATATGTTTRTCCPAPPRWSSASTSATCPPSSSRRCRSSPASYVQRAGRAGRRTGNAFLVTFADRRAREQYYFAEPRQMIAGEIVPPGCYLSAIEILRRQYVAHLADLAARGQLPGVLPMPRRASALFGESGWLRRLLAAATGDTDGADQLADGFLDLFPRHVDDAAREELRDFAEPRPQGQGRRGRGNMAPPPGGPARPPGGHRQGDERAHRIRPGPARVTSGNSPAERRGVQPGGSARSAAPTRTARWSTSGCCRTTR